MQKSVRTMWDVMRDVAISASMLTKHVRPSFDQDIRPLFERMSICTMGERRLRRCVQLTRFNEWTNPGVMVQLADRLLQQQEVETALRRH